MGMDDGNGGGVAASTGKVKEECGCRCGGVAKGQEEGEEGVLVVPSPLANRSWYIWFSA